MLLTSCVKKTRMLLNTPSPNPKDLSIKVHQKSLRTPRVEVSDWKPEVKLSTLPPSHTLQALAMEPTSSVNLSFLADNTDRSDPNPLVSILETSCFQR